MPHAVSLSQLAAALEFSAGGTAYLDMATGQVVTSTAATPAEESAEGFKRLPGFTEQDEIELARQFAAARENGEDRRRLELALASVNPREAFEAALFRCGIANAWFPFRDGRLLQRAKDWLEAERMPYVDDVTGPAN